MADKVQLIKEEIERMYKKAKLVDCYSSSVVETTLERLSDFIDSLPEEHNEDLEEAAQEYSFNIPTQLEADIIWKRETEQHFKDGAEWHNNQMKEILQTEYEKGRFDIIEEMIKVLVGGEVVKNLNNQLCVKSEPIKDTFGEAKFGDKVKIVVLKNE